VTMNVWRWISEEIRNSRRSGPQRGQVLGGPRRTSGRRWVSPSGRRRQRVTGANGVSGTAARVSWRAWLERRPGSYGPVQEVGGRGQEW
jgi:hypothetical protein